MVAEDLTAVVNVGVGAWHPKGTKRLDESLTAVGYAGARLYWTKEYPPGSPTHQDHPYGFKPYAMAAAAAQGSRYVLWCDSSLWAVRALTWIWDELAAQGHVFLRNGWYAGEWCSDAALQLLGITREAALQVPQLIGGCMALDLAVPRSQTFFAEWLHHARTGAFQGAWSNKNKEVSGDSRVLGHRHDQAIASLLAHKHGMLISPRAYFSTAVNQPLAPDTVFLAQGM